MSSCPTMAARAQRGFILITGLLFLVVMTLVALAMFRGTGLMERISANARDKQRSFEAAQTALQYGEWWLGTQSTFTASACNGLVNGDTPSNIHVCSNALASLTPPWANAFTHTPPNLSVNAAGTTGGLVTSSDTTSDTKYNQLPGFYLEYLGISSSTGASVYQVTAYGYGGDATTMTVVRSTYAAPKAGTTTAPSGSNLGGL
jgi:type IV pilus assembly protein PilX